MKKFLAKLKSCYCPHPTKKKPPSKPAASIAAIHCPLQIHSATPRRPPKRRRCNWEPALSDISEDSREDRDSVDDNKIVITKPKKKPAVVILPPHKDNYHDREWWKSMPIVVSSLGFSMG